MRLQMQLFYKLFRHHFLKIVFQDKQLQDIYSPMGFVKKAKRFLIAQNECNDGLFRIIC